MFRLQTITKNKAFNALTVSFHYLEFRRPQEVSFFSNDNFIKRKAFAIFVNVSDSFLIKISEILSLHCNKSSLYTRFLLSLLLYFKSLFGSLVLSIVPFESVEFMNSWWFITTIFVYKIQGNLRSWNLYL